jgi:hypothetical protein
MKRKNEVVNNTIKKAILLKSQILSRALKNLNLETL